MDHPIFGTPGWHSVAYEDGDYLECPNPPDNVVPLRDGADAFLAFLRVHSFSSYGAKLSRDRPYAGQAHTFQGAEGAVLIKGLTYRDIGDALHEAMTEMDVNPNCQNRDDWDLEAVVQNALCNLRTKKAP